MKKITKFFLCGALLVFLLTPVSEVKADWQRDNVGWWYLRTDGSYYKNVGAKINGKWYKFDERGYMITGWHLLEYFGDRGEKITSWYYFDPVNGDQKFGWQNINGKWYYLTMDGALTGKQTINGKRYYFDLVNCDMKTGWVSEKDSDVTLWYYFDPVNGDQKFGWQNIDGKWYYLTTDGAAMGDKPIDGKWYYFDPANGDMKTGWVSRQGFNGTVWAYYDLVSGEKLSGWQNIDGKWYYFNFHALTGRQNIDGKWYFFDWVNCDMKTGWFELNGSKYYADPDDGGALALNKTLIIDGVPYSFDDTGRLIQN